MNLSDATVMAILDEIDRLEEAGDKQIGSLRSRIFDEVLATMTPPQRQLLERWHSYICEKCGHTMIAHTVPMRKMLERL